MSAEVPEGFAAAVGIDWADRKRERGKAHHAAIRALAFKWLRTLYRCWQEHKPYDEVAYLKALHQRGLPLLQRIAQPLPKAA